MRKIMLPLWAGLFVWSCSGDDDLPPAVVDQDAGDGGQHDSGPSGEDASTNDSAVLQEGGAVTEAGTDAGPDADAAADADADAGVTCGAPGQICQGGPYNFAFLTSAMFVPGAMTIAQADAKCEEIAQLAGIGGKYVAWRSSSASDVRDRLGTASGWLRTDRRPFALDATGLFSGDLKNPLLLDETGKVVDDDLVVPTGTGEDGRASGDDCGGWMDDAPTARAIGGYGGAGTFRWTTGFLPQCHAPTRLYCLGADHANAVVLPALPAQARRAFLTKGSLAGDAGRDAADALCASEAGSLTGTYVALMATSTQTAAARFDGTKQTWFRTDGVPLWSAAADLAAGKAPLTVLTHHADGTTSPVARTWTGATSPSSNAGQNCADWADDTAQSHIGFVDLIDSWFGGGPIACSSTNIRVYCLEQ